MSNDTHSWWSKYRARLMDMFTSPALPPVTTRLETVCGVLLTPVRVSSVVVVAPMPITVP